MNTAVLTPNRQADESAVPTSWLLAFVGFAAMYVPVYWWAANGIWQTEEQGHGPIILAVLVWLLWGKYRNILALPSVPALGAGGTIFGFGLLTYVFGRMTDISILMFASQIPVVLGVLLILKGWAAARIARFPLLYMIFMVPLPGVMVDAITGQLKQWVSVIAENLLYFAGYPIGRTGVTLTVGQYQLLVADACSGLNSMFSLTALGLLYMYMMKRPGYLRNGIMLASIIPIAFAANIIRVCVLVLVTYHLGDEAGQGFLHGAAGMVLMLAALVSFFALDSLLGLVFGNKSRRAATA